MHCLYGGYNLHRFSHALGLVSSWPVLVQLGWATLPTLQVKRYRTECNKTTAVYFQQLNAFRAMLNHIDIQKRGGTDSTP